MGRSRGSESGLQACWQGVGLDESPADAFGAFAVPCGRISLSDVLHEVGMRQDHLLLPLTLRPSGRSRRGQDEPSFVLIAPCTSQHGRFVVPGCDATELSVGG